MNHHPYYCVCVAFLILWLSLSLHNLHYTCKLPKLPPLLSPPRFKFPLSHHKNFVPSKVQTNQASLSLRPTIKHIVTHRFIPLPFPKSDAMASAFYTINTIQPGHRTANKTFNNPNSPFLGSSRKLRLVPFSNTIQSAASVRRQSTIVAVSSSDVVKKKKINSSFSHSDLVSISVINN